MKHMWRFAHFSLLRPKYFSNALLDDKPSLDSSRFRLQVSVQAPAAHRSSAAAARPLPSVVVVASAAERRPVAVASSVAEGRQRAPARHLVRGAGIFSLLSRRWAFTGQVTVENV